MTHRYCLLCFSLFLLWACNNDPEKNAPTSQNGQDPALAKLNDLVAQNPNNDSILYLRARAYYELDAYDEAIRDLSKAIQIDSMQPAYYHLLGDALLDYARPGDSKRALDVMELAAQRFPTRYATLLKLSEFQLIVRQHSEALKTLDKILQRDPQNAEAFFMAGRIALDGRALRAAVRGRTNANVTLRKTLPDGSCQVAEVSLSPVRAESGALTHFVGHASVDRWTFEPLLLAGQLAASLTNATSPTIVAQWGCWSSYFVSPLTDSIANQFLFDTDGGAAAVIGAGTRIQSSDGDESLRTFMAGVGTGNERIGDAIDAMRRASPDGRRDLVYGINLLGDPTLKVRR